MAKKKLHPTLGKKGKVTSVLVFCGFNWEPHMPLKQHHLKLIGLKTTSGSKMLAIFNTNELRLAVEVAKLQGDIQYILENSPGAQELIKHIQRQELVTGYSCLIGGAE